MNLKFLDINYLRAQGVTTGQVIVAGSQQNITSSSALQVVNGNVGIGTSAVPSPLTIAGNLQLVGSNSLVIFSNGTAQGSSADTVVFPGSSSGAVQYNNGGKFGGNAAKLYWDAVNQRLGVGTNAPRASFQIIDVGFESTNTSTSSAAPVILDSFPVPYFRSCHYIIQITDENSSWYQTSQLMIIHDGFNAFQTEYNIIYTYQRLGELSCQISGGNVELLLTAFFPSNKNIKVIRTSIEP